MSLANVSIVSPGGQHLPPAMSFRTEAAATAILAGEPVKVGGTGGLYVIPSADAEPLTSAPTFVGIAATSSNHTATANGDIDVYLPAAGIVFGCKAKSAAAFNTVAEIDALRNALVLFDLTTGVYTVDTAVTSATSGLKIVGGDASTSSVYFVVRSGATIFA